MFGVEWSGRVGVTDVLSTGCETNLKTGVDAFSWIPWIQADEQRRCNEANWNYPGCSLCGGRFRLAAADRKRGVWSMGTVPL